MLLRNAFLLLCVALASTSELASNGYISHQFNTLDYPLLHLTLNNKDGKLYISAVNRIYQLDKNMELSSLIEIKTGPVNDSEECLPYLRKCSDSAVIEPKDNYNKLLVMDADRNRLLICGSIYQGLCEARDLTDISQVLSESHCKEEPCVIHDLPVLSCLDEVCTTLAVIAEGPTVYNPVLYVATTVVDNIFRSETLNSISTRSLHIDPDKEHKLLLWTVDTSRKKSYLNDPLNEKLYTKYFKYGFATDGLDGFVYFLFQKVHPGEMNTTTIARVCKKDPFFNSYVEMNLTCDGMPQEKNGELVGAFYQKIVGKTDFSLENSDEGALYVIYNNGTSSSLCIYTIEDLNQAFDNTVLSCYKHRGMSETTGETIVETNKKGFKCDAQLWITADTTLDDTVLRADTVHPVSYYDEYTIEKGVIRCGAPYLPTLLKRIPEVPSTWSYRHEGQRFSAVTVDLVDGVNVAYIGTEGGQIIELDVNHKKNYNTIDIGQPILADLTLDKDSALPVPHLYVLTSFKVYHMKVSICERHTTCTDCLGARDPYCGWCILKSRCIPESSGCSADSWLKPLSEQCIEASVPEPLERTLTETVTTKVKLLPALSPGARYDCLFYGNIKIPAVVNAVDKEAITCTAPKPELLPANLDGEDYVNVTLSILYNDNTNIVSTTATFYECKAHGSTVNQYQPCQSCLVNRWEGKCQWCVESHACVPAGTRTCLSSVQGCPKVTTAAENFKLLAVGVSTEILVNVTNLPLSATGMQCRVQIEGGSSVRVDAVSVGEARNQVKCMSKIYKYSSVKVEVPANVTLYWKPGHIVDAEEFNPVSFYNCSIGYNDCSLCITSIPEYKCGWCGTSNKCVVQQLCDVKDWVTDAQNCPLPEIKSFSPTSGPIAGNTLVTISGTNLGVKVSDVQNVSVAGIPCQIRKDLYKVSNQIACLTGAAPRQMDGKISATVRGSERSCSDEFHYRNPVLQEVNPPEGPLSGGILIEITGTNLDTGLNKEAFINKLPCPLELALCTESAIHCRTSSALDSSRPGNPMYNLSISVEFDGFAVELRDAFSYIEDPEISTYTTASGTLASFLAGGRDIIFKGKRLNLVQKAHLRASLTDSMMQQMARTKRRKRSLMKNLIRYMRNGERHRRSAEVTPFTSECKVLNSTHMICPSPEVSLTYGDNFTTNVSDTMQIKASLRVIMDNVNLKLENAPLTYYPNPVIENLEPEETQLRRNGSLLKIKVRNLREEAIQDDEIKIMISESRCPVDTINFKGSVNCRLPPKPEGEETTFPVTVQMGNKVWSVGDLSYHVDPPPAYTMIIAFIVIGVVVVIGISVGVGCYLKKQKHYKENKNDFKKTIENLEMTVQADFRKAFAELSTDMTDLTADIGDVGLPILSYRQYATNMFFPSVRYHPCMQQPDPIPTVEQGFMQFDLLITNKHFLMSFVHTLEQQRGFSNRDKGNVASLITVVLHKKLDYFTEVMKSLISELVVTSVQRNPKLVLRRTESVAERMFSNWLAICLFPYIRDNVGKPLFLLQKAIKHQVSKGPLDAVTGKTRYTLSDDSLLKEDVPCETLTLFVSQSDTDEPIIVKVLSCDSISQVKEKIMDTVYKRMPFSTRPKADQLDLEWRHGRSGHLVLPDNDFANEPGSRWRRVMTIKDYKVENNTTMALVQRQQKLEDVTSQFTNQSAEASPISPMLHDDNMRVYHLMKYADDIEQKRESTILRDKHKHILDLYLLRLINMKGILQSYVDEVFQAILDTDSIPPAVKHFFDLLDDLAKTNGIENHEILHIWKTNSVLGRFWVTILKNPQSVFDIDKPESVESSMAVISQTFIDACSVQEHKPTKGEIPSIASPLKGCTELGAIACSTRHGIYLCKGFYSRMPFLTPTPLLVASFDMQEDSPINKQLYAKEIPTYKKLVQKYYQDIQELQPVSDQDMSAHMTEISRSHDLEFDVHAAHSELWGYVNKYYEEIHETLSNDPNATQMLIQRLQQAYTLIDSSINNA